MLFRTHLIITIFFALLFFQYISNLPLFLFISVLATALPDVDTRYSKIGHYKLSRIFNFFVKHRGIVHSFTLLLIISVFLFSFFRQILFPFILGYSLHLIADSFTPVGIMPFYPLKMRIKGKIRTGGVIENFVFIIFLSGSLFLFLRIF